MMIIVFILFIVSTMYVFFLSAFVCENK